MEHETAPDAPGRRWALVLLVAVGLMVALALAVALRGGVTGETIAVDVPPGTMERIESGDQVQLLPRTLRVEVGDTLEVVNRDDHLHEVGPYTVGPGQTVRQTFTSPGTIEGVCTLHPAGAITIVVS